MIFEMIGFIGLIVLALLYFSKDSSLFGLFASFLVLMLGFWIQATGIQIQSGQLIAGNDILTGNTLSNLTSLGVQETSGSTTNISTNTTGLENQSSLITKNQTITNLYSNIPSTPFATIPDILGISFILLGIYGIAYSVVKMMNGK